MGRVCTSLHSVLSNRNKKGLFTSLVIVLLLEKDRVYAPLFGVHHHRSHQPIVFTLYQASCLNHGLETEDQAQIQD
jgi:hypothetical protein